MFHHMCLAGLHAYYCMKHHSKHASCQLTIVCFIMCAWLGCMLTMMKHTIVSMQPSQTHMMKHTSVVSSCMPGWVACLLLYVATQPDTHDETYNSKHATQPGTYDETYNSKHATQPGTYDETYNSKHATQPDTYDETYNSKHATQPCLQLMKHTIVSMQPSLAGCNPARHT